MNKLCAAVLVVSVCLAGCAHERSFKRDGEVVDVRLVTKEQLCDKKMDGSPWENVEPEQAASAESAAKLFNKLSGIKCESDRKSGLGEEKIAVAPIAVAGAGMLLNYGLDYASDALKNEAKLHQASFGGERYFKDVDLNDFNGIEIIRRVGVKSGEEANPGEIAYRLIIGYWLDESGEFYWAGPLYFETMYAKAKVARNKALLSSTAKVNLSALWVENNPGYKFSNMEIASFKPMVVKHYPIDEPEGLVPTYLDSADNPPSADDKPKFEYIKTPFPLVPVTKWQVSGMDKESINLWLKVEVSEIDESKAEQLLNEAAGAIDKNKDKIVNAAKSSLSDTTK